MKQDADGCMRAYKLSMARAYLRANSIDLCYTGFSVVTHAHLRPDQEPRTSDGRMYSDIREAALDRCERARMRGVAFIEGGGVN